MLVRWGGWEADLAHRVLLVDDSQAMRTFVEAALEEQGDFEVETARTGFEALKLLPAGAFDLLITDINMPDLNGLELIRFARSHERYRTTPVLIISTEGGSRDVSRAMELGANEYLVKPFTPDQLVEMVRRHLA
jgi:two-component system chemotaxis response regulator CheY